MKTLLVESILDCMIHGPCGVESFAFIREAKSVMVLHATERTDEITNATQRFWECENTGIMETRNRLHGVDHIFASFEKTVKRDGDIYKVRLPWKETLNMEDNKEVANKIDASIQKTLERLGAKRYNRAMKKYFTLGVVELATSNESEHVAYYMPHQAVIRED